MTSFVSVLAGFSLAACSGTNEPGDEPTESLPWQTEPTASESAEPTPDEAAIDALEAYWRAIDEAGAIPDPAYPALEQVASDQALDGAIAMVQEQVDEGTKVDGVITLANTKVIEKSPEDEPTEIVIETCVDNSTAVIVDAESGIPVDDVTYGRRQARAVVLLGEDGWFVRAIHTQELGTC
jgi:hypothetical protein